MSQPGDELYTTTLSWQEYLEEAARAESESDEEMNDVAGGAAVDGQQPTRQD